MAGSFVPFGEAHLAVVALTILFSLGLIGVGRVRPGLDLTVRRSLAGLLMLDWAAWLGILYHFHWLGLGNILPLNLCDWATIAAMVTLLQPNRRSFELAYFWSLGGTLPALVTPDVVYGFPDIRFIVFFAYHIIIIAAVLYLTFVSGLRPMPGAVVRALGWTLLYFAVAGTADLVLGTNYGYIRAKPSGATLLHLFSPWPYYLPELVALGTLVMLILYAPFYLADRRRASALQAIRP